MIQSVIQPKRPAGNGWTRYPVPASVGRMGYAAEVWVHDESGITAITAVEAAVQPEPGGEDLGPEYHLSLSGPNRSRVRRQDARWVLKQFGLEDATEDNHVPSGFVRNFWRPVADKFSGYECPCQDSEPAMVEDKGDFVWRGVTTGGEE